MQAFDYAVIGKGLIGSAAARYLSATGARVVVIGPDEPEQPARHKGVFSSHYDQGRITRLIGRDAVYSKLAEIAIEQYAFLEEASAVRFHHPVGMLVADAPHIPDGHMKDPLGTARALGREFTFYDVGDRSWKERFPPLDFPVTHSVLYEPSPAGYINPRELIKAELELATRNGAAIVCETVCGVRNGSDFVVTTVEGNRYLASNVLVAAGAFTNFNGILPEPLAFRLETESVLLAEVTASDAERLEAVPTVIHLLEDPEIWDVYMTPPIEYPDGRFCIKLGANSIYDRHLETLEDVQRWFRTGDSDRCKPALERTVLALWPGLEILSTETKRCILCRTPNGYPMIDELDDGIFVAAGGNGGSAKCSDALGRLAAGLMEDGSWLDDIPRDLFRAAKRG